MSLLGDAKVPSIVNLKEHEAFEAGGIVRGPRSDAGVWTHREIRVAQDLMPLSSARN